MSGLYDITGNHVGDAGTVVPINDGPVTVLKARKDSIGIPALQMRRTRTKLATHTIHDYASPLAALEPAFFH